MTDPDEAPYLTNDAEDLTGTSLADELGEDPDRICDRCGQANHAAASSCRGCGNVIDGDDAAVATRRYAGILNRIPRPVVSGSRRGVPAPAGTESPRMPAAVTSQAAGRRPAALAGTAAAVRSRVSRTPVPVLVGASAAVAAAVVVVVWMLFFRTFSVDVEVTDTFWSRAVEVEEFRTLQRSDFDPPSDARIHDSYRAVHHTEQVVDHHRTESYTEQVPYSDTESYDCSYTSDNGNGTFTQVHQTCTRSVTRYRSETRTRQVPVYRDEPVYRTKYDYEIDRWVTDLWFEVDEHDAASPFWPETIPAANEPRHRVGDGRRETYTITVAHDGKTYDREPGFDVWKTVEVGAVYEAHMNRSGQIRSVDWDR